MRIPMLHTPSAAETVSSLVGESSATAQTEMYTDEAPRHPWEGKAVYPGVTGAKVLSIVDCESELVAVADFGFFESIFSTVTNSYSLWCLAFKCFCISDVLQ